MKFDKVKHSVYCMVAHIFFSAMLIQLFMEKGTWVLHGQARFWNAFFGIFISATLISLYGFYREWRSKQTGKGIYDKADILANTKGLALATFIMVVGLIILRFIG